MYGLTEEPLVNRSTDHPGTDRDGSNRDRARLLTGVPVAERRFHLAGIPTAVLTGGDGPPLVLLHGPGEFAGGWVRVIPSLATTHQIICPDLPGHGSSGLPAGGLDTEATLAWLGELLVQTCAAPPVLVGRVLGGAIAARFAIDHGDLIDRLVLVDTLGLEPFAPAPRFELAMHRFFANPIAATYDRFMDFCAYDLDRVRDEMGDSWAAMGAYAVERAGTPSVQAAAFGLMGSFGTTIPPADLARITVPTTLVWGRHDLATRLAVAETASAALGWPLHVIDDAGDDPALERPEAFVATLRAALAAPVREVRT